MAYDEELANRIRGTLRARTDITERRMFGGLAFLCEGRMCCGIVGNDLMVRVPIGEFDAALRKPYVRPMDFTGKPLKGFVYVSPSGFVTAASLRLWLTRGERAAKRARVAGTGERPRAKKR
jgi:TfoX N-terminal domain